MQPQPVRPFSLQRINAGSSVDIPYQSVDENRDAVDLTGLRYRIDNLTDGVVIQSWTTVADPAQSGNITIPGSTNTMSRQYRETQLNQVTVEMTTASGVKVETPCYEIAAVFTAGS